MGGAGGVRVGRWPFRCFSHPPCGLGISYEYVFFVFLHEVKYVCALGIDEGEVNCVCSLGIGEGEANVVSSPGRNESEANLVRSLGISGGEANLVCSIQITPPRCTSNSTVKITRTEWPCMAHLRRGSRWAAGHRGGS